MSGSDDEVDILGDTPPASVSAYSDLAKCEYLTQPRASSWLLDSSTAPSWCDNNIQHEFGNIFDLPNNCLVSDNDQQPSTSNEFCSKWTDTERELLREGLDMYDLDLQKLATFIGSKTFSEIKYFIESEYGPNFKPSKNIKRVSSPPFLFKSNNFEYKELLSENDIPASIEEVITMVSTAETTVSNKINNTKSKYVDDVVKSRLKKSSHSEKYISQVVDYKTIEEVNDCDEVSIRNILRSNISSNIKNINMFNQCKSIGKDDKIGSTLSLLNKGKKLNASCKKKIKRNNITKNIKSHNIFDNIPKINKGHSSLMQIVTGSGQILQLSEGEQVIKIEKRNVSDIDSDVEIDIDDDSNVQDDFLPKKESQVPSTIKSLPVVTSNLNLINVPDHMRSVFESTSIPDKEFVINDVEISDLEKILNQDFFTGRNIKTPERYLLIRSHILNAWYKNKPQYLTKTMARNGLKNCGDVNSISRVHTMLEQIGAINFGCEQTSYTRPLIDLLNKDVISEDSNVDLCSGQNQNIVNDVFRQRKIKMIIDGDGGFTITHSKHGESCEAVPEPKQHRLKKKPVNLLYCKLFDNENPAPYSVHLSLSTLILMDVHSYTSRAEVMGLLGGKVSEDKNLIFIKKYIPCDSLENSGTHCDMCPVSQSRASELLIKSGLETVGWYHSHPLFPPHPSTQDILSQVDLQTAFLPRPFLAIILSPFWPPGRTSSQYKCFITRQNPDGSDTAYEFKTTLYCDLNDNDDISVLLENIENIYNKQRTLSGAYIINLKCDICTNTNLSYLEKFMSSVKYHLNACSPKIENHLYQSIIDGITKIFNK